MRKIKISEKIKQFFNWQSGDQKQSLPIEGDFGWSSLGINPYHYVSAQEALRNSDIFSLVSQISADLAIAKFTADSPRVQALIDDPSVMTNGHAFWQSMYAQLLLSGECFAYRWRNVNGVDLHWEYLRPSQVQPLRLNDGSGMLYNISFDEPDIGRMESVPASDMIHIRLMSIDGGLTGMSPLNALSNELNIKKASNDLTMKALNTSIASNGVLSITNGSKVSDRDKINLSKYFMEVSRDPDAGPIVLDDLTKYTPLEIKSDTASLLKQADWTGTQIAKVYGVPDSYLNGQGDQQSSITQLQGMYANALNRFSQAGASELDDKMNAHITVNLRPALDPSGNNHATMIQNLTSSGILQSDQAVWLLKQDGFLPEEMPNVKKAPQPVPMPPPAPDDDESSDEEDDSMKGGET
ncbi:phage portal protein [Xylocopilactobacillus apis]|uniref:phage portal protein n=1 Tax=Xylocopilactobacillus apis TaxID=2932183 RepID=UPI0029538880|nr:phage portal protein [Xylocopilactobacillus apis]